MCLNQCDLILFLCKNIVKSRGWPIPAKWKCQCYDLMARKQSNMVRAREQSKTYVYMDPFSLAYGTASTSGAGKLYLTPPCKTGHM